MTRLASRLLSTFTKSRAREAVSSRRRRARVHVESLEWRGLMSTTAGTLPVVPALVQSAMPTGTKQAAATSGDFLAGALKADKSQNTFDIDEATGTQIAGLGAPFNIQVDGEVMHVTAVVSSLGDAGVVVQRAVNGVLQAHSAHAPVFVVGATQQPKTTIAITVADTSLWITNPPTGLDYNGVYKIQIDQEQMLVQPSATSSDWNILARGVDGTLEQPHGGGAPIQFLGTAAHDAGWNFFPNQPDTDLVSGTAATAGPELVLVPGQVSKTAMIEVLGYSHAAGDTLQVIIPQVKANQLPNNLPGGINVFTGHGFTTGVVSQEDPSNMLDLDRPTHTIDLMFSAVAGAPKGITPIDVIVRQRGEPDVTLHLNLVVNSSPPAAPANVQARAVSASQVNLSWSPVAGATGYVVDRYINGAWARIASLGSGSTSYAVPGLPAGTTTYFSVAAVNAAGQTFSPTAGATTFPGAPTNLKAYKVATSEIQLTWTPAVGATGYAVEVYYGGAWHLISQGGNGSSYYQDISGLAAGSSYYLIVGAYNASGLTWSSEIQIIMS